eukprot:1049665-Ditylum_brightwellii.AAC.1
MMIAPTRTRNGIKYLLHAPNIFAITGQSMMERSMSSSVPFTTLGTMMIMEAILPRTMTPGRRQWRKGRKPPTITPI